MQASAYRYPARVRVVARSRNIAPTRLFGWRREAIFRRLLAVADVFAVAAALLVGVALIGDDQLRWPIFAAFPMLVVLAKVIGIYDRDEHVLHETTLEEAPALFQVATLFALLLSMLDQVLVAGSLGADQVLGLWGMLFAGLLVGRTAARALARFAAPGERCIVIGDLSTATLIREKLSASRTAKAEVTAQIPAEDWTSGNGHAPPLLVALDAVLAEAPAERVIVAPGTAEIDELLDLIREIKARDLKISVLSGISRMLGSSVELDHVDGITLLGVRRFTMSRSSHLVKRAFDVAVASAALALTAPLMLAIAIAVRLDSSGSVLFRQRRIGRDGTSFNILKFRSMVEGAENGRAGLLTLNEAEEGLFKIAADPRLTRTGRLIRRWHLDELPQLFNVLRGEMSIVGPRPLVPEEDQLISGWERGRLLHAMPGITGHWQLLGPARVPLREMVKLDYLYVANWSLWGDLKLLLRTIPHVLRGRGM